jgi:hypothetical protein
MKKLSYYLFTFLILSKLLNAQSAWDSFNLPSSQNYTITDIKFIDGNTGFVIAVQPSAPGYAMFYKTTNKGYNWCIIAPAFFRQSLPVLSRLVGILGTLRYKIHCLKRSAIIPDFLCTQSLNNLLPNNQPLTTNN